MATDQATFAAALAEFATDITDGLAAVTAALPTPVDLTPELEQLTQLKTAFDAFVDSVVPAPPAPEEPPA